MHKSPHPGGPGLGCPRARNGCPGRIATPELEESLVNIALNTTAAQVERVVAGYRRANQLEARPSGRPARSATAHWDDDGSLVIRARLTPEEGALYLAALEAMRHQLAEASRHASDDTGPEPDATTEEETAHQCAVATYGYDETAEAYWSTAADALVAMATGQRTGPPQWRRPVPGRPPLRA